MTELGKIVAICLVGILLALLLQKNNPELAILLALAVCAGVLVFGLEHMKRVLAMLEQMAQAGGLSSDLLQPLMKTVGIDIFTLISLYIVFKFNIFIFIFFWF